MHAFRIAAGFAVLCALAQACAPRDAADLGARPAPLQWPPSDLLSRTASDDTPFMRGTDYAQAGGQAAPLGEALVLGPDGGLSWAVYSLQGFGPEVFLDKLELDFAVIPGNPDQNTQLYVALANYTLGRWEWIAATEPQLALDLADFADYYSPSGSIHLACVLGGNGSARIFGARFYRTGAGASVAAPENLTATPVPAAIQLSWDPVLFPDGYNVYRSLQNDFSKATKRNLTLLKAPAFDDTSVVKLTDYYYWVTAVRGPESAPSVPVMVTSLDTTLQPPQNLQVTANVGSMQLTWDPVEGATSYRIQRSRFSDFSAVNNFITGNSQYDDSPSPAAQIYYYRVVAIGIEESLPSSPVNAFMPTANLPAPQNFVALEERSDGDFVILNWEYSGSPAGFNIYIHRDPDFALDGDLVRTLNTIPGGKRAHTEFGLPAQGGTFYCRICARDADSKLGRMSPAISFTNNPAFVFAPQQGLGANATYPVPIATDGTELAAAYFEGNNVRVAQTSGGSWSAGQNIGLNSSFGIYMDMAAGDGKYMVAAMQTAAGDCWVSIGAASSWTTTRIHGDGNTGDDHPVSGQNIAATCGDGEFAVTHVLNGNPQSILVQTRPTSGGSWSTVTAANSTSPLLDLSLTYHLSDLFLGVSDFENANLLLGSRDGSWDMQPINLVPGDGISGYNNLGVAFGQLVTPASDINNPDIYLYRDNGTEWTVENLIPGIGSASRTDLATHEDKLIITFLVPTQGRWYYAYYNGSAWSFSSILTLPVQPASELRVVMLSDGSPYIVFEGNVGNPGELRGAPGYFL